MLKISLIMTPHLLNLKPDHLFAALLSGIPALLNLGIFIYMRRKLPDYKITRLFSLFLLALISWQLNDTLTRLSGNSETVKLFNSLLNVGTIFTAPLGLHFALLYINKRKIAESLTGQIFIYLPSALIMIGTLYQHDSFLVYISDFWGWVYKTNSGSVWAYESYWIACVALLTLSLFWYNVFRTRHTDRFKPALLIAAGFSIPVIQGILTEVVIPAMGYPSVPITTLCFTIFSIATLIAITHYRIFNINESLKIPTILGTLTDMLIVVSSDGNIRYMNKRGLTALGVSKISIQEEKIESFFSEKENERYTIYDELILPALSGQRVNGYMTSMKTAKNERIDVLISATAFSNGGKEQQLLLLVNDISNQLQTAQELAKRENELKEKNAELETFFYRATHDLKGPSASIIGLVQLAKMEGVDPSAMEYIDKIETSARQLEGILLEFIRIIHIQEREVQPVRIDFDEMIAEIIQPIKYRTKNSVSNFRVHVDCSQPFFTDKGMMNSILYNLINNAVNYKKKQPNEESYVEVEVIRSNNGINIWVRDNGIGIPQEIQRDIFNIFFRGSESSKGTGLGLYIVKSAVNKLHGHIYLDSQPGKGTSFHIYIPQGGFSQEKEQTPVALTA